MVLELLHRDTVRAVGANVINSDPVGRFPVGSACLVEAVREGLGWLSSAGRQFLIEAEVVILDGVELYFWHVCSSPNTSGRLQYFKITLCTTPPNP